jgi:murein DD-endopeptidase MepM/ murein hydrolase activator NlpD
VRKLFLAGSLTLCAVCFSAGQTTPLAASKAAGWAVRWQPQTLVNGAPVLFRISTPVRLRTLSASWLRHDLSFFFDSRSKTWYGLAGVRLETKPGKYVLVLKGAPQNGTGEDVVFEQRVAIARARYPSVSVTVAKKFTEPSPEKLEKVKQDKTVKEDVFRYVSEQREWSGVFLPPATARISDVFGTQRTFNGKVQSMHQGLDYAVPAGTPVSALNAGTVLLAQPLYLEGNCVVLDHGQGLLTLYLHLSEFTVKEGEHVARGQQIGLSGGTGRATGPHLHVAVRWQGVYLNPATLLTLRVP